MSIQIETINNHNKHVHNKSNEPFELFGKLEVEYKNDQWYHAESLFNQTSFKHYDNENIDLEDYIMRPDKTILYAFENDIVLGQIVIRKNWNKFCFIDDISVKALARKKQIGSTLIKHAQAWAIDQNLKGFMLETQDINLGACRFYLKNGFVLGSLDTMLYNNSKNKDEKALLWYKTFEY